MSRVSVIVVSRERPRLLQLCLTGIGQQCCSDFEVIVVADEPGVRAVERTKWRDRVKLIEFNLPNISAARNAGLSQAAGDVVAFIDDDAVPEPTWLCHLAGPFADPHVSATGGYVIGRNGISIQWAARAVNRLGQTVDLEVEGADPFEPAPPPGFVPKTEGTNCAFRHAVLTALGGFDPAFRYFLDETDVNVRLAEAGARTVIVPRALVHHGYAASPRRAADRAPRDLAEIGASTAVFLRKHAPVGDHAAAVAALTASQRRGLLRHMVAGGLEPRDVGRLLEGLSAGVRDGMARQIDPLVTIPEARTRFRPFRRPGSIRSIHLAGRPWQRRRLHRAAAEAVGQEQIVTIFRFNPTALPHRVRFHPGGWWEQVGGLFGPAERHEPAFRIAGFRARVARELARVSRVRQCR